VQDAREPGAFLRVLLAEDNAVIQRLAVRPLEKRGHSVVVAGNGLEALHSLEKESFDLIFMDVQMPEMQVGSDCFDTREGKGQRTAPGDY